MHGQSAAYAPMRSFRPSRNSAELGDSGRSQDRAGTTRLRAISRRSVLAELQFSSGRRLSFWRVGSGSDCGYLVVSPIIESDRKPPSTRPEIVVVLESMNPLPNILIIHERSKIFFLQNIKFASVAAYYRAG